MKKAVWVTVQEYREKHNLNSRESALYRIKRDKLETKKEERDVTQKQLVTVVKVEVDQMKRKLRFGNSEYNIWESCGIWMAKMVGSKSPFWCYQETSEKDLLDKMKEDHSFPLVKVEE